MDDPTYLRWLEIQFYYICSDMMSVRNNPMDLMDLIDALAIFGSYSPEQIKPIAHEILVSTRCRPGKEEFMILSHRYKVPVSAIKKRINAANRTLYELLKTEENEPRPFYPRLHIEQTKLLQQFVETFNKFREIGVYNNG